MRGGNRGRADRADRDAARPDLEGPGRRHDRHRRHPEALQRHHPDLRPGPLLVPHGAALHDARGLRHHPRPGLGLAGLLGLDPRPDDPGRRATCSPKGRSRSRSAPTTSTTTPSPRLAALARSAEGPMSERPPHWRAVLAEVDQAGLCSNPVRLRGITLDRSTGELAEGGLLVPCKDRRAAVCPSCSRLYQADAWQLVAAGHPGRQGGRPERGRAPPALRHADRSVVRPGAPGGARPGVPRPCRPRRRRRALPPRRAAVVLRSATAPTTIVVGEPLCAECFDYRGAVLWNAHVPRLWERTSLIASTARWPGPAAMSDRRAALGGPALLHQGGRVPAPGPRPPPRRRPGRRRDGRPSPRPPGSTPSVLTRAVERAVASADVAVPAVAGCGAAPGPLGDPARRPGPRPGRRRRRHRHRRLRGQVRHQDGRRHAWLAHPIRSAAQLERLELRPHIVAMVAPPGRSGGAGTSPHLRLRAHAHTLGYTGQFSSKSLRFSTTFTALRQARAAYVQGEPADDLRLRRRVALRRPGLRPPRGRRAWPKRSSRRPGRFPTGFPARSQISSQAP